MTKKAPKNIENTPKSHQKHPKTHQNPPKILTFLSLPSLAVIRPTFTASLTTPANAVGLSLCTNGIPIPLPPFLLSSKENTFVITSATSSLPRAERQKDQRRSVKSRVGRGGREVNEGHVVLSVSSRRSIRINKQYLSYRCKK